MFPVFGNIFEDYESERYDIFSGEFSVVPIFFE